MCESTPTRTCVAMRSCDLQCPCRRDALEAPHFCTSGPRGWTVTSNVYPNSHNRPRHGVFFARACLAGPAPLLGGHVIREKLLKVKVSHCAWRKNTTFPFKVLGNCFSHENCTRFASGCLPPHLIWWVEGYSKIFKSDLSDKLFTNLVRNYVFQLIINHVFY